MNQVLKMPSDNKEILNPSEISNSEISTTEDHFERADIESTERERIKNQFDNVDTGEVSDAKWSNTSTENDFDLNTVIEPKKQAKKHPKKQFRVSKYKDAIFFEKKLTKSDKELKTACIQGDIKTLLKINDDHKKRYLLDVRTNRSELIHFNTQGRMAGSNFWLREHKSELDNKEIWIYLAKKEFADKILIVIDFFEENSNYTQFLLNFYRFYKNVKKCAFCGYICPPNARVCPKCGDPFDA